jgi:hypothetical protein
MIATLTLAINPPYSYFTFSAKKVKIDNATIIDIISLLVLSLIAIYRMIFHILSRIRAKGEVKWQRY